MKYTLDLEETEPKPCIGLARDAGTKKHHTVHERRACEVSKIFNLRLHEARKDRERRRRLTHLRSLAEQSTCQMPSPHSLQAKEEREGRKKGAASLAVAKAAREGQDINRRRLTVKKRSKKTPALEAEVW